MISASMEHASVQMHADVTKDLRAQDATKVCRQIFPVCNTYSRIHIFFVQDIKVYWLNTKFSGLLPAFICTSSSKENKPNRKNYWALSPISWTAKNLILIFCPTNCCQSILAEKKIQIWVFIVPRFLVFSLDMCSCDN